MPSVTPSPQASGQQSTVVPEASDEQNPFFIQEDLPPFLDDGQDGWSSAFAVPFQLSEPVAVLRESGQAPGMNGGTCAQQPPQPTQPSASAQSTGSRRQTLIKVALISAVVVLGLSFLGFSMFAQAAPSLTTTTPSRSGPSGKQGTPSASPTVRPQPTPQAPSPTAGTTMGSWVPTSLPAGWTNAGLSAGDALFAERTAVTFTDQEMSLNFRNSGTRAQHGGTMTEEVYRL